MPIFKTVLLLAECFMLYSFAKILMTTGLRFFYRHIYVTGLENIPSTGPAIIIANHNSSLMDAALLGILLRRKAWFFARGDVFVNKPVQKILWWLHMMPVHSHQGGKKTLNANQDSFSAGQRILSAGGIVVFFPESYSHVDHQLLPFRKGVFRLAFDTAAKHEFSFDIPVVPVGITYDDPVACRTTVQVHAGKPLSLAVYKNEYLHNPAAALLHICKDAQLSVQELVLHVPNKSRLQTLEHYLILNRCDARSVHANWKIKSAEKLRREQKICAAINEASGMQLDAKKQKAEAYFGLLKETGLNNHFREEDMPLNFKKRVLLLFGFPFYLIGLLLNGLPILTGRTIADKKVLRKDFYSWIFIACCAVGYFVWLLVLIAVTAWMGWISILVIVAVIITGIFAYIYRGWLQEHLQLRRWNKLAADKRNELVVKRAAIERHA